ncbi:putative Gramicidin S biosynthesis protein GrsT [Blattamonas nauphoetae]|uniref:Gramicidin S biosynthesis protein GrsT n=1 Tax=Blattamonas nauphoetae TaxID=2049346 RepID=A0ABQ9YHP5_9EUKA|nr:putative Gramicidin S biosynthesis protein GrsT [Blattamonas nauphoetae]
MLDQPLPSSKWLSVIRRPESKDIPVTLRLLCFSHAGAAPVMFNQRWAKSLPEGVQVVGILFPGRTTRSDEPPIDKIKDVIPKLIDDVQFLFKKPHYIPYVVFGHSFGASCSLEFCLELKRRSLTLPISLLVSGRNPPQLGVLDTPIWNLPEDELQQKLFERYDAPIVHDPDMKKLTIPPLRADLSALDTYMPDAYTPENTPLPIPISVFYGENDGMMKPDLMPQWAIHTSLASTDSAGSNKPFSITPVKKGGHFMYDNEHLKVLIGQRINWAEEQVEEKPILRKPLEERDEELRKKAELLEIVRKREAEQKHREEERIRKEAEQKTSQPKPKKKKKAHNFDPFDDDMDLC